MQKAEALGEAGRVVADCARLRENAAQHPMTIVTAIERARYWRSQPETVVDSFTAKQVIDALLSALERSRCYFNATMRGQDTFVLVEQGPSRACRHRPVGAGCGFAWLFGREGRACARHSGAVAQRPADSDEMAGLTP